MGLRADPIARRVRVRELDAVASTERAAIERVASVLAVVIGRSAEMVVAIVDSQAAQRIMLRHGRVHPCDDGLTRRPDRGRCARSRRELAMPL